MKGEKRGMEGKERRDVVMGAAVGETEEKLLGSREHGGGGRSHINAVFK